MPRLRSSRCRWLARWLAPWLTPWLTLALTLLGSGGCRKPRDLTDLGQVERNDSQQVVGLTIYRSAGDRDLSQLGALPHLSDLTLQECELSGPALARALAEATHLETVAMIRVALDDEALAALGKAPGLRRLVLGHVPATGIGLQKLSKSLEELVITSRAVTAEGMAGVVNFPSLRNLELNCGSLPLSEFPDLTPLHNLRVLNALRTPLGPQGLERLQGLTRLAVLRLNASELREQQAPLLNSLASLQELDLIGAAFSDAGWTRLRLPQVRSLSLASCPNLTDAGLANLAGMTGVTTLNLTESGVVGKDLTGLKVLPRLKRVILSGNQFQGNRESLAALKKLLPECEVVILRG